VADITCGYEHACVRYANNEASCIQLGTETRYKESDLGDNEDIEKIYAGK